MPCYDKKLEASRPDFATDSGNRDVDCVLTTGEVQKILDEKGVVLSEAPEASAVEEEQFFPSTIQHLGSSSGGYLHNAIAAVVQAQAPTDLHRLRLEEKIVRGEDYVEYVLRFDQRAIFRGAKCYGFRNLQNVVRKVGRDTGISVTKGAAGKIMAKRGGLARRQGRLGRTATDSGTSTGTATPEDTERGFDFIEVMACPSGCVNGGGQIAPPKHPLPVEVDREGMPIASLNTDELKMVVDQQDGHRVLSGKEWVTRVEDFYWQLGAKRVPKSEVLGIHASLANVLDSDLHSAVDQRAFAVVDQLVGPNTTDASSIRNRLLRTQYRSIASEEVNGLAVKW